MPMGKKHGLKWVKETLDLKTDHRWESQEGYKIFVAGRGAVRFDVPQDWKFEPQDKSFRFMDADPPDNDCNLEVSYNQLPPNADFSDFPLMGILNKVMRDDEREVIAIDKPVKVKRQTARIVWGQSKFIDPDEKREAYSRICIGLGSGIQCLITFDYWVDDAETMVPVWDTVISSLTLGLYIRDPRVGLAFPD
ncbi:MAG: hypothetical protein AAFR99_08275 [Cyanobacteria bacterium J06629_9]